MLLFVLITLSLCLLLSMMLFVGGFEDNTPVLSLTGLFFFIMIVISIVFTAIKLSH